MFKKDNTEINQQKNNSRFSRIMGFLGLVCLVGFTLFFSFKDIKFDNSSSNLDEASLRIALLDFAGEPYNLEGWNGELAQFGKKLFFDARLSASGKVSCATCHKPEFSFSDGLPTAHLKELEGASPLLRNTPALINPSLQSWFFWDGSADSLAMQAFGPLEHPLEHGFSRTELVNLIVKYYNDDYEKIFGKLPISKSDFPKATPPEKPALISISVAAYGLSTIGNFKNLDNILSEADKLRIAPAELLAFFAANKNQEPPENNLSDANGRESDSNSWSKIERKFHTQINQIAWNAALAIEEFQKGLTTSGSPFDNFLQNYLKTGIRETSLTETFGKQEFKGLKIFVGKAKCNLCHHGPNFTDQQFHNIGLNYNEDIDTKRLPVGRAAGVVAAASSKLNCYQKNILGNQIGSEIETVPADTNRQKSESCIELKYFDFENFENVGAFKTPSLRNIKQTGPYMHDGRFKTLEEVIDHYENLSGKPAIGHMEESLKPLDLSSREKKQLVKFLESLSAPITDTTSKVTYKL